MVGRLFVVSTVSLMMSAQAFAQTEIEKEAAIQDILACRGLVEESARLLCLDAALPALAVAFPQADLSIEEQEAAVERQREKNLAAAEAAFGQTITEVVSPQPEIDKEKEAKVSIAERARVDLNELTSTVVKVDHTARKKAIVYLENGQVWRQLDSDSVRVSKTRFTGDQAVVKEKIMDSFMMKLGNSRTFRVRRIR